MKNTIKNNPKDLLFFKNLVIDSYSKDWLIDKFIVFKSLNNILYLIYSNNNKSIISYNIIDNKKINEIKNAHNDYISSFRYYLDNINQRDLIISLSSNLHYYNIKLWNINNFELILNIQNISNYAYLKSASFLNDNNKIYIITCFVIYNKNNKEPIKVFDFKGNKIKEINESEDNAYYINNYYDNDLLKNYILTGNSGYIKSYDYNENKIYHKYSEKNNISGDGHISIIINKKKEIIELIDSCCDGNIRIWNFHSGIFLRIINVSKEGLREICMWNNEYLLVGCDDKAIKLINLNNGKIIKEIEGHNNKVLSLKIIFHPLSEKCLISQGAEFEPIKLWIIKN